MAHYISNHLGDVTRASSRKTYKEYFLRSASLVTFKKASVKNGFYFRDTHPNWLANTCPINFSFLYILTKKEEKIEKKSNKKMKMKTRQKRRNAFGRNKDRRFSFTRNSVQDESDDSCQIGGEKRSGRSTKKQKKEGREEYIYIYIYIYISLSLCKKCFCI